MRKLTPISTARAIRTIVDQKTNERVAIDSIDLQPEIAAINDHLHVLREEIESGRLSQTETAHQLADVQAAHDLLAYACDEKRFGIASVNTELHSLDQRIDVLKSDTANQFEATNADLDQRFEAIAAYNHGAITNLTAKSEAQKEQWRLELADEIAQLNAELKSLDVLAKEQATEFIQTEVTRVVEALPNPEIETRFDKGRGVREMRFKNCDGIWCRWFDLTVVNRPIFGGGSSFKLQVQEDATVVNANAKILNFTTGFTVTKTAKGVDIESTGGSAVAVEDDDVPVIAAASTLNFGDNLIVTDDGAGKVTIDGSATFDCDTIITNSQDTLGNPLSPTLNTLIVVDNAGNVVCSGAAP